MSDELLKSFILYCQGIESAYHEWKSYWLNYYMNQPKEKPAFIPGVSQDYIDKMSDLLGVKWHDYTR